MAFPIVSIVSVSNYRISDESGKTLTTVTFNFDIDIVEYVVRVVGTSHDTGILAHQFVGNVSAGTNVAAEIDWTECYQEGENRVNIYGKNASGQWTPYGGVAPEGDNSTALTFAEQ